MEVDYNTASWEICHFSPLECFLIEDVSTCQSSCPVTAMESRSAHSLQEVWRLSRGGTATFSPGWVSCCLSKELAILKCCLVGTAVRKHTQRAQTHTHAHTHSFEKQSLALLCKTLKKSAHVLSPILPLTQPGRRAWCPCVEIKPSRPTHAGSRSPSLGLDARPTCREGHGSYTPWRLPLPLAFTSSSRGKGAVAGACCGGWAGELVCVSSSHLLWGSWAEGGGEGGGECGEAAGGRAARGQGGASGHVDDRLDGGHDSVLAGGGSQRAGSGLGFWPRLLGRSMHFSSTGIWSLESSSNSWAASRGRPLLFLTKLLPVFDCLCSRLAFRILFTWSRFFLVDRILV